MVDPRGARLPAEPSRDARVPRRPGRRSTGRTIGNLYLTDKEGGFTDDDQRIVETFARHAAIAMENARLHEQVQRLAIVEERERIGKDLHDGVIQSIYAVGLSLEDVPEIMDEEPDEARRRVERAIDEPRPDDPRHPQLHLRPAPRSSSTGSTSSRVSPRSPTSSGSTRWSTSSCAPARRHGARPRRDRTRRAALDRPRGAQQHRPPRQGDSREHRRRAGPDDGRAW